MAWDVRAGGKKYYYRSRRDAERVSRQYFGAGLLAEMAAEIDAEKRAKRREFAARFRAEKARLEPFDQSIVQLDKITDLVLAAMMVAAGFHRTNYGPWRRRRVQRQAPADNGHAAD
jgi:hypothetical protein